MDIVYRASIVYDYHSFFIMIGYESPYGDVNLYIFVCSMISNYGIKFIIACKVFCKLYEYRVLSVSLSRLDSILTI